MFTRKPDDRSIAHRTPALPPQVPLARAAPRPARASGSSSTIGPNLRITGNLESSGELQIDGEVQGDIHAARVVVGQQGQVTGAVIADEIDIGGTVQGSIRGNNVTFRSASHIEGDVFHRALTIEQGAYFEGKSRRSNDPMSVAPEPLVTPQG